ncbi:uncharacterized protein LOC130828810 [Amaranthus tricolor]|uniref:uncharacterized protein LOC130828810 n=1 Tax=Amaranthus tricolor TaxID=29722 RepID=UPI00258B0BF7|nr:uncharacterized protein LOC130828810 [Amaranthus tricolor]
MVIEGLSLTGGRSTFRLPSLVQMDVLLIYVSCVAIARTSFSKGCLIYEIFAGMKLNKTEELRNTSSIPKSLIPDYQILLSSMPSKRLNTSKLIENSGYAAAQTWSCQMGHVAVTNNEKKKLKAQSRCY